MEANIGHLPTKFGYKQISGVARIFPVGGHWGGGASGFRKGGTKMLRWQPPPPPPPHPQKSSHFPAEQADKQKKKSLL